MTAMLILLAAFTYQLAVPAFPTTTSSAIFFTERGHGDGAREESEIYCTLDELHRLFPDHYLSGKNFIIVLLCWIFNLIDFKKRAISRLPSVAVPIRLLNLG